LRQAVDGYEKTLGSDHRNVVNSKYYLGRTICEQEDYGEADELLRRTVDGYEKMLGIDHRNTLNSKHWLGVALYGKKEYSKAERLLRQTVDMQEVKFGNDDRDTIDSKHWLGVTLFRQKEYSKAERLLRQAADGYDKALGSNHRDTLNNKYWLGYILDKQRKYGEIKVLSLQPIYEREEILGSNHGETPRTARLPQRPQSQLSSLSFTTPSTEDVLNSRLSRLFQETDRRMNTYTESEIFEIISLLKHLYPRWSKVPRTYIVLRSIDRLDLVNDLIDNGFSDYCFPVTERSLPGCIPPSVKTSFVKAQRLVLTSSMDLERGKFGRHCHYSKGESPPLESKGILGSGGFGQVDRVLSLISFKEYARKQVPRGRAFRGRRKEDINLFISEIEVTKRLKHYHIVEFVGSYTDSKCISLIMSPVAQMDLATYLKCVQESSLPELRTFFGCLATALEYLHEQKVRHKDIKPSNILVNYGRVLFTDFGLSRDFADASGGTTTGMTNMGTARYFPPEVALHGPRSTKADIWSLGAVFMEMLVILKGRTSRYMDEFYKQHGSWQSFDRLSPVALMEFVAELERMGKLSDNQVIVWTQKMLSADQQLRPTASSLVESILSSSHEGGSTTFCGICCAFDEEESSN
jgi:tetratricopeptide (TPR) repeat protein